MYKRQTIRPFLLNEKEAADAPEAFKLLKTKGIKSEDATDFTIAISPLDCVGCGNCVEVCPAPNKALIMKPKDSPVSYTHLDVYKRQT